MKIQAKEIAEAIIDNIGKIDNIKSIKCCSRRIRFKLKNASNTKEENIKRVNGIIGIIEADDKYYIILEEGQNIKVYNEIVKIIGKDKVEETISHAKNEKVDKKEGFMKRLMNAFYGNKNKSKSEKSNKGSGKDKNEK